MDKSVVSHDFLHGSIIAIALLLPWNNLPYELLAK
jgi:hypothetical protein